MSPTVDSIALRRAFKSDAEKILRLEEVCMKDYATAIWGSWTQADTVATLDVSTREMIEADGEILGCIATRWDQDALHLIRLYLAPAARNHGVGSNVLHQVIGRAASHARLIKLRVLVNNPAIRFYARHDFRVASRTDTHVYMVHDTAQQIREPEQ